MYEFEFVGISRGTQTVYGAFKIMGFARTEPAPMDRVSQNWHFPHHFLPTTDDIITCIGPEITAQKRTL